METWLEENLVCPRDLAGLRLNRDTLICEKGHRYPYVNEIPIMLLEEAASRNDACLKTLEQIGTSRFRSPSGDRGAREQGRVDSYVQEVVAATCGMMYKPLIGNLTRYPIPELPLPRATGERLLDVGSNWGRWSLSAARKGYAVVGIDPSFDAVRSARRVARQLGLTAIYIVADARHLPFSSRSFDVVFSYSVLQHFEKQDVKRCLAEIRRTLRMPGLTMIQMANKFGVRNLYHQLRRGFREPTAFEVRYWRLSELERTFVSEIGPTSLSVEAYFSVGVQKSDIDMLPAKYKLVIKTSEKLRSLSKKLSWMRYFADSVYVRSWT